MKTRSQNFTQAFKQFTIKEVEAAKALVELKAACNAPKSSKRVSAMHPSGRPRRSTAPLVNYSE